MKSQKTGATSEQPDAGALAPRSALNQHKMRGPDTVSYSFSLICEVPFCIIEEIGSIRRCTF